MLKIIGHIIDPWGTPKSLSSHELYKWLLLVPFLFLVR